MRKEVLEEQRKLAETRGKMYHEVNNAEIEAQALGRDEATDEFQLQIKKMKELV